MASEFNLEQCPATGANRVPVGTRRNRHRYPAAADNVSAAADDNSAAGVNSPAAADNDSPAAGNGPAAAADGNLAAADDGSAAADNNSTSPHPHATGANRIAVADRPGRGLQSTRLGDHNASSHSAAASGTPFHHVATSPNFENVIALGPSSRRAASEVKDDEVPSQVPAVNSPAAPNGALSYGVGQFVALEPELPIVLSEMPNMFRGPVRFAAETRNFDVNGNLLSQLKAIKPRKGRLPQSIVDALRGKVIEDKIEQNTQEGVKHCVHWTQELDDVLWYLHHDRKLSFKQLCFAFASSNEALDSQLYFIAGYLRMRETSWTDSEDDILRVYMKEKYLTAEIAKLMNRKVHEIKLRRRIVRRQDILENIRTGIDQDTDEQDDDEDD